MDASASALNSWLLQHHLAQLRCGVLTGRLDLSHPGHGLHDLSLGGEPFDARLLCIYLIGKRARPVEYPTAEHEIAKAPEWIVQESYVRGRDLIASYPATNQWPYSPEFYWRSNPEFEAHSPASLSLVVSVNTHLLDSWPRISIQTCLRSEEVLHLQVDSAVDCEAEVIQRGERVFRPSSSLTCLLHRLSGREFSYAEIVPATDFCEARVQHNVDDKCYARWELFGHFLEKGVIRRARLQSLILPRENDVEAAVQCCRMLEKAPLPLTT